MTLDYFTFSYVCMYSYKEEIFDIPLKTLIILISVIN